MNIPILTVRDEEGNIIETPALKGGDGKDCVLTDADKEFIRTCSDSGYQIKKGGAEETV